ncbi:DUF502 domain-containing protein [Pseudidiomarina terrestris]|uniref:DUF502 domain-containing protein n=1 Tax=Pseudidiomarina terrestris TaxID=2820060 RepID=A0AAW7R2K0_9GAMM|nr:MULTISPECIES: DUF502 domain-containing protein [unclassified Pseudidiomarina]MDN7125430.1 DUF502 domain-containing protein [Pseudidiomarina sp. 1APP75-32.1]MDN7128034.1 DUF502 domain-containing protein [Pseudidiomarina sp. 1APR75-33.1]MDN7130188.1 DUF502 domain-containing protein [Pseudidiomarina sp. 1APR75-15]MDN7135693.1 DUF502 domain-containing protein [Pseudidiomarina sp. 1ASP75-5]MDN7137269.1 DUF502 domain-containing protein [Pseudidiomarina sp. 1ASP75-14]
MKNAIQYLLKGLAILLPIIVTIALVRWLLVTVETWLSPIWLAVLGESFYFPGLAFISFLGIAVFIGFSARWRFINRIWTLPGVIINKLPLLSSLYGTVNDVFEMMSGKNFARESVVMVTLPGGDVKLIGIITKKSGEPGDRLSECLDEDYVAVFLPMSYNVGGYMVMVPRSCIEHLDMSPADALQLTISGGLGKKSSTAKE